MAKRKRRRALVPSGSLREALAQRLDPREWQLMFEVPSHSGWMRGLGRVRFADALALNLYPSQGCRLEGFEFKERREDWLLELGRPEKSHAVKRYCDRWWLVARVGIYLPGEVPQGWGVLEWRPGEPLRVERGAPRLEPEAWPREFVAGMVRAAAKRSARLLTADEAERSILTGRWRCPSCGSMTRETTAGCDHCGLEDK